MRLRVVVLEYAFLSRCSMSDNLYAYLRAMCGTKVPLKNGLYPFQKFYPPNGVIYTYLT